MAAELLDHGRVQVAPQFVPLLRANGLHSFDAIMSLTGGRVARDFPGRRTVRLELPTPHGGTQALFLKRYEADYLSGFAQLLRWLRWPGTSDEAMLLPIMRSRGRRMMATGLSPPPGRRVRARRMAAPGPRSR